MSKEKIKDVLPEVAAIVWPQIKNKEGLHPIKIRVTYDRKSWYQTVQLNRQKVFLPKTEGQKIIDSPVKELRQRNREIKIRINDLLADAREACRKVMAHGDEFSIKAFEEIFLDKKITDGVFYWFDKYLADLKKEQRVGTYNSYSNVLQALKRFKNDKDLTPDEITPEFLKEFEKFLLKGRPDSHALAKGPHEKPKKKFRPVSQTTVSIYMRGLKAIYNFMADKYPKLKERYPFATKQNDKRRYKISATTGRKGDAMSKEVLLKFLNTQTIQGTPEHEAKLFWLFSFYCKGMNVRDIFSIKYSNILPGDILRYTRQKTSATTKDARTIWFPLRDEAKDIIMEIGNTEKGLNEHIFPLLCPEMDAFRQNAVIKQKTKVINKWLKRLCQANNLPPVTTYWARHTYATISKYSGVSLETIKEDLGHGDLAITEAYLRGFDLEAKREADKKISAYMKKAS